MALQPSDLLVVQRVTGPSDEQKHYSLRVDALDTYMESTSSVTFKGKVDLTAAPSGSAASPNNGDLYINTGVGSSNAGWNGITAGTTVAEGDQVIYDGDNSEWILTSNGSDPGGQVDAVQGTAPIQVDATDPTEPVVSVLDATTSNSGVVQLASTADVTAGTSGVVVTADQLKTTNDLISAGGGGTVTEVTGTAPIEVANGTAAPVVSIKDDAFAPYDFSSLDTI